MTVVRPGSGYLSAVWALISPGDCTLYSKRANGVPSPCAVRVVKPFGYFPRPYSDSFELFIQSIFSLSDLSCCDRADVWDTSI